MEVNVVNVRNMDRVYARMARAMRPPASRRYIASSIMYLLNKASFIPVNVKEMFENRFELY